MPGVYMVMFKSIISNLNAISLSACVLASSSICAGELFYTTQMRQECLKSYNNLEQIAITKDLEVVRSVIMNDYQSKPALARTYVATVGAQGSNADIILESFLEAHPQKSAFVYVDSAQRGLKFMAHTYINRSLNALSLSKFATYKLAIQAAHEKWFKAADYITQTILEEAFAARQSVAHGSLKLSEQNLEYLNQLKRNGYKTVLLLCGANDETRKAAAETPAADQHLYLNLATDVMLEGRNFAASLPLYVENADEILIYWTPTVDGAKILAARIQDKKLSITDPVAYSAFTSWYEAQRTLNPSLGLALWEVMMAKLAISAK
jgi:hypothetical protein